MSTDQKIAAGLFVLAAVTFGYFTGGAGWNQDAHFDLTRAIVERQTLYIDGYDVNTGDVSKGTGGHIFINKPPGASILAAAPYAVIYGIERRSHAPVDSLSRMNRWISTALSVGLCGALIGSILYLYGRRKMAATPTAALCVGRTDCLVARVGLHHPPADVTSSAGASSRRIAVRPGPLARTAPAACRIDDLVRIGSRIEPARAMTSNSAFRRTSF